MGWEWWRERRRGLHPHWEFDFEPIINCNKWLFYFYIILFYSFCDWLFFWYVFLCNFSVCFDVFSIKFISCHYLYLSSISPYRLYSPILILILLVLVFTIEIDIFHVIGIIFLEVLLVVSIYMPMVSMVGVVVVVVGPRCHCHFCFWGSDEGGSSQFNICYRLFHHYSYSPHKLFMEDIKGFPFSECVV